MTMDDRVEWLLVLGAAVTDLGALMLRKLLRSTEKAEALETAIAATRQVESFMVISLYICRQEVLLAAGDREKGRKGLPHNSTNAATTTHAQEREKERCSPPHHHNNATTKLTPRQ